MSALVQERATTAPLVQKQLGLVARLRNRISTVLVLLATLVVVPAGAASAQTTTPSSDLTGGAGDGFFDAITTYFQQHVIGAVLALFALTIGVGVLMGWGRKAAKSK